MNLSKIYIAIIAFLFLIPSGAMAKICPVPDNVIQQDYSKIEPTVYTNYYNGCYMVSAQVEGSDFTVETYLKPKYLPQVTLSDVKGYKGNPHVTLIEVSIINYIFSNYDIWEIYRNDGADGVRDLLYNKIGVSRETYLAGSIFINMGNTTLDYAMTRLGVGRYELAEYGIDGFFYYEPNKPSKKFLIAYSKKKKEEKRMVLASE